LSRNGYYWIKNLGAKDEESTGRVNWDRKGATRRHKCRRNNGICLECKCL